MVKKLENLIWVLLALFAIVASVGIIISVLLYGRYSGGTYGPWGLMGGYYGMGIIMPVLGTISVIFVIVFIYFIFEALLGHDSSHGNPSSGAEGDIVKERLAKGEITDEEYLRLIEKIRR